MTAPSLPDTLRALSRAFPHRFTRLENWPEAWWAVWWDDPDNPEEGSGFLSLGRDDAPNLGRLEYALREECEARGWEWTISGRKNTADARIDLNWHTHVEWGAETSAHALALSLLDALTAEGGQ